MIEKIVELVLMDCENLFFEVNFFLIFRKHIKKKKEFQYLVTVQVYKNETKDTRYNRDFV